MLTLPPRSRPDKGRFQMKAALVTDRGIKDPKTRADLIAYLAT